MMTVLTVMGTTSKTRQQVDHIDIMNSLRKPKDPNPTKTFIEIRSACAQSIQMAAIVLCQASAIPVLNTLSKLQLVCCALGSTLNNENVYLWITDSFHIVCCYWH